MTLKPEKIRDEKGITDLTGFTTDDLTEGSSNLYFNQNNVKFRNHLTWGNTTARSSGGTFAMFAHQVSTNTTSYTIIRNCDLTGISFGFNVTAYTPPSFGTTYARLNIRKNGSNIFTSDNVDITATGNYYTYKTQDLGLDTFSAGDRIDCTITILIGATGAVTIDDCLAVAELTETYA